MLIICVCVCVLGEVEDPEYDDCMSCEEGCNKCVLCKFSILSVLCFIKANNNITIAYTWG